MVTLSFNRNVFLWKKNKYFFTPKKAFIFSVVIAAFCYFLGFSYWSIFFSTIITLIDRRPIFSNTNNIKIHVGNKIVLVNKWEVLTDIKTSPFGNGLFTKFAYAYIVHDILYTKGHLYGVSREEADLYFKMQLLRLCDTKFDYFLTEIRYQIVKAFGRFYYVKG